ncbi:MAG TPA: hypothetical protein VEC11_00940 [Allosphingosinicella sp.]|nr:hypothetical protein [Allosphingosinicella sp.]
MPKKPIKPLGIAVIALAILWFLAAVFAARYLAAWLYAVDIPDREQIRTARAVIAAPFAVPFLLATLWLYWNQRREDKAIRRRRWFAAKLADPSHELRLDRERRDVD